MTKKAKTRPRGRPVKNIIKPIRSTPERLAQSIMQAPPKEEWDYLKKDKSD